MSVRKNRVVTLGNVITSISRGIQLSAAELEQCTTDKETGYRYLSLADMREEASLQLNTEGLRRFDPSVLGKNVNQYCLQPDMILITKNDTPFKIDIAGSLDDEKIIVSGNIYMISADKEKVIPRWLCYWLQSEEGMSRLRSAAASTNNGRMKWISIKQISGIVIPDLSFQQQADLLIAKIREYSRWMERVTREFRRNSNEIFEILKALGITEPQEHE